MCIYDDCVCYCVVVFFFFKQKTAYEMRISDWSSDVCSSDLYYIVHDGISTRMLVDELLKAADRGVRVRILLDDTTSDGQDQTIATLAAHPRIQIGRASCRERVCQYV